MDAREIARGGLLAAAAVALLYVGGAASAIGPACCIAAGVASAVPLLRRAHLRTAVMLYLAASLLGALIVPRKGMVVAYVLFCGLYPVVKYLIEARLPRQVQMGIKLVYFNIVLAVAGALAAWGLLGGIVLPGFFKLAVLWFAANFVFMVYDIGLSRLIAVLRRMLPPE